MYRSFVEVTVVEVFDDENGWTEYAGVVKIGDREVWRGDPKRDMETAYTQAEATLAAALEDGIATARYKRLPRRPRTPLVKRPRRDLTDD